MSHYCKHKCNTTKYHFSKVKFQSVPCLHFISPPVSSQCPVHSIYCNLSSISPSHLASHNNLLTEILLSDGYINWFAIYFLICKLFTFEHFRWSHKTCLGSLLFSIMIAELCNVIVHCKYLLFADDIKTFHAIHSVHNCIWLQSDTEHIRYCCTADCTEHIQHWCTANCTEHVQYWCMANCTEHIQYWCTANCTEHIEYWCTANCTEHIQY